MYKNIQIRNALECVPRSQCFSVSREVCKRLPQWKKKASEKSDSKKKTTVKENVNIDFCFKQEYCNYHLKVWWHIL